MCWCSSSSCPLQFHFHHSMKHIFEVIHFYLECCSRLRLLCNRCIFVHFPKSLQHNWRICITHVMQICQVGIKQNFPLNANHDLSWWCMYHLLMSSSAHSDNKSTSFLLFFFFKSKIRRYRMKWNITIFYFAKYLDINNVGTTVRVFTIVIPQWSFW